MEAAFAEYLDEFTRRDWETLDPDAVTDPVRVAVADAYDAVYVAAPNATHLEYVEAAAEQGKAVLCEKPLEAIRAGPVDGFPRRRRYRRDRYRVRSRPRVAGA